MTLDEDGNWTYAEWIDDCVQYRDRWLDLRNEWNKYVAAFNATIAPRAVGRPLAASEAQVATVLNSRKRGVSLRGIAEETNLGLPVRTIVDKRDRRDRTTIKHLARIDPDRNASW